MNKLYNISRHTIALLFLIGATAPAYAGNVFDKQIGALDKQIDQYQKIVDQGGWGTATSKTKLEPGATHADIAHIRHILALTGDLNLNTTIANAQPNSRGISRHRSKSDLPSAEDVLSENFANKEFYDSHLLEAVKHFQARHALMPDGVVGPATRAALNTPAIERLAQLMVSKDRVHQFAAQHAEFDQGILVNIPGYRLYLVEGGNTKQQMNVIVGQKQRQTHQFSKEIAYLEFNPQWYVPQSIATKDLLPKIQNDPDFVRRSGFRLTQDGHQVDAQDVDWTTVDSSNFNYRLTQNSGSGNALGKVKFMIPNNRSIYLHDTSKPYLFERGYRALSSGCIRVEDPLALTQFVLMHGKNYAPEEAASAYQTTRKTGITLDTPIPVHAVYWTAWVDEDSGLPNFYEDIYGQDRQLISEKKSELEGSIRVAAN